jgi:hypothetical protein
MKMEILNKVQVIAQFDIGGRSDEIAPMLGALIATGQQHSAHVEAYRDESATKMVISITLEDRGKIAGLLAAIGPLFEALERAAKLTRVQCFGAVDDVLLEMLFPFGAEFFVEWAIAST